MKGGKERPTCRGEKRKKNSLTGFGEKGRGKAIEEREKGGRPGPRIFGGENKRARIISYHPEVGGGIEQME